jgi:RNA polymerase sigma factor (sigma-70 family)
VKDLRVQVRLYNNQLKERREATGLSACAFARSIGVQATSYCALEAMTTSPVTAGRYSIGQPRPMTWKRCAIRVAEALKVPPDVLWPESLQSIVNSRAEFRVNAEEVAVLASDNSEKTPLMLVAESERQAALETALKVLTPVQREVIEKRFGICGDGDGSGLTLEQIAKETGRTRERIRQIEAKALRILRHPDRSKRLREFIDV